MNFAEFDTEHLVHSWQHGRRTAAWALTCLPRSTGVFYVSHSGHSGSDALGSCVAISASFISGVHGAPEKPGLPMHVPSATDPEGVVPSLSQPICFDIEPALPLE